MPPITPGDMNSVVNQVNQNIAQQNTNQITQIFKDDTGTRRVLLGKGADGFYGLKVSQSGTDVYSAADSELIFNSSQDIFKIVQAGTVNLNVTSTGINYTEFITVDHNLGYTPLVMASANVNYNGSGSILTMLPYILLSTIASNPEGVAAALQVHASSTQITFRVDLAFNTVTLTGNIRYYILQESAS